MRELAILRGTAETADELETKLARAIEVLARSTACVSVEANRGVEDPLVFVLNVVWTSVEDHLEFRESELMPEYRSYVSGLLSGAPEFAHYRAISSREGSATAHV
ncbi:putative quinol monooxygenase [Rhodococcus koreensis]|uniref:putative quinol monooxygenase n=1 Tax=Rhodococcus koreensis TaxID=99653 RepID=UPI0036DF79DB